MQINLSAILLERLLEEAGRILESKLSASNDWDVYVRMNQFLTRGEDLEVVFSVDYLTDSGIADRFESIFITDKRIVEILESDPELKSKHLIQLLCK